MPAMMLAPVPTPSRRLSESAVTRAVEPAVTAEAPPSSSAERTSPPGSFGSPSSSSGGKHPPPSSAASNIQRIDDDGISGRTSSPQQHSSVHGEPPLRMQRP